MVGLGGSSWPSSSLRGLSGLFGLKVPITSIQRSVPFSNTMERWSSDSAQIASKARRSSSMTYDFRAISETNGTDWFVLGSHQALGKRGLEIQSILGRVRSGIWTRRWVMVTWEWELSGSKEPSMINGLELARGNSRVTHAQQWEGSMKPLWHTGSSFGTRDVFHSLSLFPR